MRNPLNYKWFLIAVSSVILTPHDSKNAKPVDICGQFLVSKLTEPSVQKLNLFGPPMKEKTCLVGVRKSVRVFTYMELSVVKAAKN